MRRLLLTFLFPIVGLSQNYVGDHEGNIYQWINYGTLDWPVKNADNLILGMFSKYNFK